VSELIISVSGLRGVVGHSLTPEVCMRYACAFAAGLDEGPIVITRDGRTSGRLYADAVRSGLCAIGRDVIDADLAATPTTGVLVRQLRAAGGVQVSASHNPIFYNGLKALSQEGRILTAAAGRRVAEAYRTQPAAWVSHDRIGQVTPCTDTLGAHAELVLAIVNVERIRARRFKVLLDSNHTAAGLLAQRLLHDLHCQVTHVGAEPDGRFEHLPEPTLENLVGSCNRVVAVGADVGFFPDPDGDRLAVADENGRYVGEEYTLALCVAHVLQQCRGAVVTNAATSRMAEDLARQHGVPFFRSRVGEANVADMMLAHEAIIGGEGNGGVIHPHVGYVRDSYVAMAMILDALAESGKRLSQLVDVLPRYQILKTKIACDPSKLRPAIESLAGLFSDAEFDDSVGLRLNWPDKWLLLHPSNTEPFMRIIAEAKSACEAQELIENAARVLEEL